MSLDDDLSRFNQGLDDLFKPKPIKRLPEQAIRHEEQKAPWHKQRTRRIQSDVYSMVSSYHHHEGDRRWLVEQLQTLPQQKREPAMMQYSRLYAEVVEQEDNENIKQGLARRTANTWLVDLVTMLNK